MKSHSSITLSALSFVSLSLAVSPPPQFNGNQNGIGSWFQTNTADSHTNGHSWCGYPYSDDQPLFAPSLALMGGATSGPSWDAQRRQYCGRKAKVTNTATGVSKLLYIGDSFAQPRSGGAIDIVIGAFIDLYGKDPKGSAPVSTPAGWSNAFFILVKLDDDISWIIDFIANMADRYTQTEWRTIIDAAERNLPDTFPEHKAPTLGSLDFAKCIDHTLLKLEATREQIDELCEEARRHDFQSVCVRLNWVEQAVQQLSGSNIAVACVVGFPEGTYSTSEKVKEASDAVAGGALELDMVINYPLLKQQSYSQVYTDIAAVRNVAPHPILLKVILETSKLSQYDIIAGCKVAEAANADFVKTSTGFGGQGATVENVRLMKDVIGPHMKVKASGGVKTVNECVAMMEAGAERIGTSNGVSIMKEAQSLLEDVSHAAAAGQEKGNSRPPDSY
ncbi:MAG: hypothetical protein L6R37_003318 [Teloschistes peruensis]|nr:MAG: hypothetical protein L6R37_003318 [Teloschistes peruensis]